MPLFAINVSASNQIVMKPNRLILKFVIDAFALNVVASGFPIGELMSPCISKFVGPPALCTNKPSPSDCLMTVCQSKLASILSGSSRLRNFGTSPPASDAAIFKSSASFTPPRIFASAKKSAGSNLLPMTFCSAVSTSAPTFAATGPMIRDNP